MPLWHLPTPLEERGDLHPNPFGPLRLEPPSNCNLLSQWSYPYNSKHCWTKWYGHHKHHWQSWTGCYHSRHSSRPSIYCHWQPPVSPPNQEALNLPWASPPPQTRGYSEDAHAKYRQLANPSAPFLSEIPRWYCW